MSERLARHQTFTPEAQAARARYDSMTNQEIAAEVGDLIDDQLTVKPDDKVRYTAGATAGGEGVGGRFVSQSQLEDISAYQDQIRDGIPDRGQPDSEVDSQLPGRELVVYDRPQPIPELKVSFVDQTVDAKDAARYSAEAKLTAELNAEGGKFKRLLRNAWKGSIAREFYILKYKKEAREAIESGQDINRLDDSYTDQQRTDAQMATIDRLSSEYDESLHTETGERRNEIADDSDFALATKDLIRRYVSGDISSPDAFREARGRLLEQFNEENSDLVGEGAVRIDNLLAIAESVKGMEKHGDGIDQILEGMKIYSSESRESARYKVDYGKIDRLMEKLQDSKVGSLVGPETVGLVAAVALTASRVGRGTLLKATGVTLIPGVMGATLGALRENKRVKEERTQHSREVTQGKQYVDGKRREQMHTAMYETVNAGETADELTRILDEGLDTPEKVQAIYEALASVQARVDMSDTKRVELFSYSEGQRSVQFGALDVARGRAKAALASHVGDLPQTYRTALGIEDADTIDQALQRTVSVVESLQQDIDAKDKAFRTLKARRVATAAAQGALTSAFISVGTQEAMAFAIPSYEGLIEHMVHGSASPGGSQTILEGLVHGQSGGHISPSSTYDHLPIGGHQNVLELPSNYSIATNPDGSMAIVGPSGAHIVDHLVAGKNGQFNAASLQELHHAGVSVADTSHTVDVPTTTTKQVNIASFVDHHDAKTTVNRDYWYNNNTPRAYDKNELGLHWAGEHGTGVKSDGTIQYNVSTMTAEGSSHGLEHTNWAQDANEGHLKLAISLSEGTQSHPIIIDVQAHNGVIDIPNDPKVIPPGVFTVEHGHAVFHGSYAEVVETHGTSANGNLHVTPLATQVGDKSLHTVPDQVTTHAKVFEAHYKLTPPPYEASDKVVEPIVMPPFILRRSLEGLTPRRNRSRELVRLGPIESGQEDSEITSQVVGPTSLEAAREQRYARERAEVESIRQKQEGLVDNSGKTSTQLAQGHPDYQDAIERSAAVSSQDKMAVKMARRNVMRVQRLLEGYYSRMIDIERGRIRLLDSNESGIDIHEKAARNPRYLKLQTQADELFKEEIGWLSAIGDQSISQKERKWREQQYEKTRKKRIDLEKAMLVLKSKLLKELDDLEKSKAA